MYTNIFDVSYGSKQNIVVLRRSAAFRTAEEVSSATVSQINLENMGLDESEEWTSRLSFCLRGKIETKRERAVYASAVIL